MNIKEQFDEARKAWPGDKNGIDPEWDILVKVCKKYKYKVSHTVPLLLPAIERYKVYCSIRRHRSEWVESPAHFQTWLNQRRWLREHPQIKLRSSTRKENRKLADAEDYTQWIKEQSRASLETCLQQMPHLKWLVKKLRPELGF